VKSSWRDFELIFQIFWRHHYFFSLSFHISSPPSCSNSKNRCRTTVVHCHLWWRHSPPQREKPSSRPPCRYRTYLVLVHSKFWAQNHLRPPACVPPASCLLPPACVPPTSCPARLLLLPWHLHCDYYVKKLWISYFIPPIELWISLFLCLPGLPPPSSCLLLPPVSYWPPTGLLPCVLLSSLQWLSLWPLFTPPSLLTLLSFVFF